MQKLSSAAKKNKNSYIMEYDKLHIKRINLRLSIDNDSEIIEALSKSKNKSETIREWYRAYKEKEV